MEYVRFGSREGAFGWQREGRVTLGGLMPETDYQLVCAQGEIPLRTDANGAWSGRLLHDVPLCVALADRVILWNETRETAASAAALLAGRRAPVPERLPEPPAQTQEPMEEVTAEEQPVSYREPSGGLPVDRLPTLIWPARAAQLKPYFDSHCPSRPLNAPCWRLVDVREAGMRCCFGYRAQDDRVCEVLYGVQARGGLVPPKGLQGYRYERGLDGSGYWVLRQAVEE